MKKIFTFVPKIYILYKKTYGIDTQRYRFQRLRNRFP